MNLITGHTGDPHIYAVDDAAIYKLLVGTGDYVLPYGEKLSITKTDAHTVSINDGYLITQGRLATIRPGSEETIDFTGGIEGYYTPYVVAAEYNMNQSGVESMQLVAIQGTRSTSSSVTYPSLTTGDIDNGETHQVGLWKVRLNGLSIDNMTRYLSPVTTNPISDLYAQLNQMQASVTTAINNMNSYAESKLTSIQNRANTAIAGWQQFYYDRGSSFTIGTNTACSGLIMNSSKQIVFYIPTRPIVRGTVKVNLLYLTVRLPSGGFPYVKSGNTYTQIKSQPILIWSGNSSPVSGISNVTASIGGSNGGIKVVVDLATTLKKPDKKTTVTNQIPISCNVGGSSSFSIV